MTDNIQATGTFKPQPMTGWKTKYGSILVAVGTIIAGSAEVSPMPEIVPWLKFVGFIVGGIGGSMTMWGVGHKIEKNKVAAVK